MWKTLPDERRSVGSVRSSPTPTSRANVFDALAVGATDRVDLATYLAGGPREWIECRPLPGITWRAMGVPRWRATTTRTTEVYFCEVI